MFELTDQPIDSAALRARLERPDAARQRRLRDVAGRSSATEMPQVCQSHEIFQLTKGWHAPW